MDIRKTALILISALAMVQVAAAASRPLKGVVLAADGETPIAGAVASVDGMWAVSGEDGRFSFPSLSDGRYAVKVELLGYNSVTVDVDLSAATPELKVLMYEQSLALEGVTVTAQSDKGTIGTSRNIGRDALNHLQLSSMTDMMALMPGGKTTNPDLTSASQFSIRSGGSGEGNAAFATAVEVDGVRMGNNASFGDMAGVDTRSVAVDNVEAVEVLSGVASAEYGDMGSGIVKIRTKRGRSPLNLVFTANPRTVQTSVSKGVSLAQNGGVLNLSAEWANAVKKLVSPYESYTRRGVSAVYSNTFADRLRFEFGLSGNLGGMDSKNDPDAFSGEYSRVNDNVLRANTSLSWQLNRPWITSLGFDASVMYNDRLSKAHKYHSAASTLPAVHSEDEGYHIAVPLPRTYFSDQIIDSRELDAAASMKYVWNRRFGSGFRSNFKAGVQWKASGNVGAGEYFEDSALASDGYRPRPYTDYPFMHNVAAYAEEKLDLPANIELSAGVRMENVLVKGSDYGVLGSFSPRFNALWHVCENLTLRGGWGVSEKLPSFNVLYPRPEYRDIRTFSVSYGDESQYVYYTQPYTMLFNPDLKLQSSSNAEAGIDASFAGVRMSLVAFRNVTENPYQFESVYTPFAYSISAAPSGFQFGQSLQIKVDNQTGQVFARSADNNVWTPMSTKVRDSTFVRSIRQNNGTPVRRMGLELTMDFPEIKALRTAFRLDASYTYTSFEDRTETQYYNTGWSHSEGISSRSFQFVGIYANGGNSSPMVCGRETRNLDANLTAITHIPEARLVVTCRLELSLLTRSLNIPAGGRDALYPVAYMTLDGKVHPFTDEQKANPVFSRLIMYPNNDFVFALDGYPAYASANISITKEIGNKVSLSFFANNFTSSRPYVLSMATGVGAIFTPSFYYGLTCRIKL